jgi:hypothetical protein
MSISDLSRRHYRRLHFVVARRVASMHEVFKSIQCDKNCSDELYDELSGHNIELKKVNSSKPPMEMDVLCHWIQVAEDALSRAKCECKSEVAVGACAELARLEKDLKFCRNKLNVHFKAKDEVTQMCQEAMEYSSRDEENMFAEANFRFWRFMKEAESKLVSRSLAGLEFDMLPLPMGRHFDPVLESDYAYIGKLE